MRGQINWLRVIGIMIILGLVIGVAIWVSVTQVSDHYAQNDPKLYQLREHLKDLHPAIDNISLRRANKSYTINKSKVHLCLYDENGKYYDDNMLVYVLIHELAHVITKSLGHTEEFHNNFELLLHKADVLGLYDKSIPLVDNYCGHN